MYIYIRLPLPPPIWKIGFRTRPPIIISHCVLVASNCTRIVRSQYWCGHLLHMSVCFKTDFFDFFIVSSLEASLGSYSNSSLKGCPSQLTICQTVRICWEGPRIFVLLHTSTTVSWMPLWPLTLWWWHQYTTLKFNEAVMVETASSTSQQRDRAASST